MFKRDTNTIKRQTTTTPEAGGTAGAKRATSLGGPPASDGVSYTEYGCTALTEAFQSKGKLRSIGGLSTFLNDERKPSVVIFNAEVVGLSPENPATRILTEQLIILKTQCEIIALDKLPEPSAVVIPSRHETLAMYTDRYVIQAKFHMGPDARLADFMEAAAQQFIVATDARIFPLFQPRTAVLSSTPMLFVHRSCVHMYHEVH